MDVVVYLPFVYEYIVSIPAFQALQKRVIPARAKQLTESSSSRFLESVRSRCYLFLV